MIRFGALLAAFTGVIFLWHECGEDFGVFCYRIGSGAFSGFRSRLLAPVRTSDSYSAARNNAECSTPSFTSSARSLAPMDFGS